MFLKLFSFQLSESYQHRTKIIFQQNPHSIRFRSFNHCRKVISFHPGSNTLDLILKERLDELRIISFYPVLFKKINNIAHDLKNNFSTYIELSFSTNFPQSLAAKF
jgi:hypothetical protein